MIKQLQDEQIKRRIDYAIADREAEIDKAIAYCNSMAFVAISCEDALEIWHDSDEYATDQAERKGDDDYTAGKEDW
jgi:hypothetical protein